MNVAKVNTPGNYVFGRPAMHDIKKLAEHIEEWSKNPHNHDILAWIDEVDIDPRLPCVWAKTDENFAVAYFKAKSRIAKRRTDMLCSDEIQWNLYNKYQHNYDIHNKTLDNEDEERRANLAANTQQKASEHIEKQFVDTISQLASLQSKRKDADNSSKTD